MFSKFSVKRPFTVFVSVILVIILGGVSFTEMTTDLLPKIDLPYVIVMTTYPGASPEKVEESVTKPLEKVLATTSGIEDINSVSSENSSMIMLEFSQDMNMDSAMIDLSGKVDLVKGQLDDEVGAPTLMKMNPDMMPIMVASVDINNKNIKEASNIVKKDIIPSFERIDGVASVDAMGVIEESVKVTLDDSKIEKLNNKLKSSIDSKMKSSQDELNKAKNEIAKGKAELKNQSEDKSKELNEGSSAIKTGKSQLQGAIDQLSSGKKELENQKSELLNKKNELEQMIKNQEENNIPVSDEQKEALALIETGIKTFDEKLNEITNQESSLNSQLKELNDKEKQLEAGKQTLNSELEKASQTLSSSEAEIEKSSKELEKAKKEAYKNADLGKNITKENLSNILSAQNFAMPAGYIKEGEEDYIVKIGDKVSSLEDLNNLELLNIDGVGEITVEDVANVELTNNADKMYAKINGNDAILLTFQKQSTSSTSEVSKRINETMNKLTSENKDIHITALQDQGVYIDIVIKSVLSNLILGGILSIIILFVFLKSIKPTIVIAFSIPISVLFAITMMYFSNVTMNIISLSGLALGVGMLVDNSIVVIENIYRLRNDGMSAKKASVIGSNQVAGAIFASTLTTVCVFLPIVFTHGLSRQLFEDMGLTIAYSLLASLIVALTLVPAMSSKMLNVNTKKEHRLFDKFVNLYEKLLKVSLKHKFIVLIGSLVLLVGSGFLVVSKGTILMPETDSTQLSVTLEMPKEAKKQDARDMSETIIDRITEIEDVDTVGALQSDGTSSMFGQGGNSVSFYVLLKEDKKLSSKEVANIITKKTKDLKADIKVNSSNMDMSALGGSGINLIVKGNDLDKLKDIAKDVSKILEKTEGVTEVDNGLGDGNKETKIIVDKEKAMKYSLTVAQVYQEVSKALKSENTATTLNVGSNEYPVIVVDDENNSLSRESLSNYKIKGTKDNEEVEVKLENIATIEEVESLNSINHERQVRNISVTASIDSEHNIGLVSKDVEDKLKDYKLPDGYTIDMGGELESMNSAFGDLIKMISLAILFIYLIMVAQFQSLLSPFIVLFTIPLAFTGGFLGLLVTGFELSMISMLGFLMLAGIVVNNGIVFIDYVNQLRLSGLDKKSALVLAGKTRIRPILMTALTTILGLLTLAMGIGTGAEMIQPMAIVTIGGLSYATVLTLFIVPIMYDILNRKELKQNIIDEEEM
ncbi:acriflavin resistance protein [[Clostridium] sordellii]|uniref:Multidrug efflux pump n=1 Tax=Paraclostridium sordellii TaxID=1505 RepID=A0ABM9RME3_PARSO|nr:efflux RND transporter permease subunit [Paeniclostridium sordellii]CEJ73208.1 putative multidrug efflux pump [[Clostridium] sordellii] [Paeniclostridium sordellii]CEN68761.1 acriflavin resistance protein [[Clostridium] sordellii] [Paeniclostridium sordellii]CEN72028.1 acriflavin resistance protein [[Clostridium] sordellii] [Paeniclostridium sordellii]CEP76379.1 acriflavin resistance protein [[Clostridium] sordellii] [Paeniclostridium sordellii]